MDWIDHYIRYCFAIFFTLANLWLIIGGIIHLVMWWEDRYYIEEGEDKNEI